MALVTAYAAMMPRLRAQEQLARVRAGGLAFGGYEKNDARLMLDELGRQARGEDREAGRPRRVGPVEMASAGIGMKVLPPKGSPDV